MPKRAPSNDNGRAADAAPADGPVILCDDQASVAAARTIGLNALPSRSSFKALAGRDVAVLGAETDRAQALAQRLLKLTPPARVRVVELTDEAEGGIAGFIDARDSQEPETIRAAFLEQVDSAPLVEVELAVRSRRASEYRPRRVDWLWPNRIPLGKLTLIAGDPKVGKSILTAAIAAAVSAGNKRGPDEPLGYPTPGDVIFLSAEDDPEDTICPRLIVAGADLSRIEIIEAVREPGSDADAPFCLDRHLRDLEQLIKARPGVRLIVIDPVSAFMGEADSHNNAEVRGVLAPLAAMAARHHVAVVCVTHLRKSVDPSKALYRAMGSLAFTAAARAVWFVTFDPETKGRRLFLNAGMNLAADPGGLAYKLTTNHGNQDWPDVATVAWEPGRVDMDADDAMYAEDRARRGPSALDEAVTWLKERLTGSGAVAVKELEEEASVQGISERTLKRARRELGVRARKVSEEGKAAYWTVELPEPAADAEGDAD